MQRSERPKRSRALQACEVCRTRKNRCNEEQPCTYCVEHDLECIYSRPHRAKRRHVLLLSVKMHLSGKTNINSRQVVHARPGRVDLEAALVRTESHEPTAGDYQHDSDVRLRAVGVCPSDETHMPSPSESFPVSEGRDLQRLATPATLPSGQRGVDCSPSMTQQSAATSRESAADVMDTNTHTRNLEFYGAASSVAFLRHVENISSGHSGEHIAAQSERSLASLLHNTNFWPSSTPNTIPGTGGGSNDRFYFRVARKFIEAYFSNIHYIQPMLDEEVFLTRCEDLWFGKPEKQPPSFIALYYVVLSLGSLVMVWDDREIYGTDRFSWSRRFFNDAVAIVSQIGSGTDLEMVQCYYMMGKVCQHELNPHVAYLYSGQATRIALAIGLNRSVSESASDPRSSVMAAKTWWAVYCLDIQTSFALGRPDSLGPDEYHTQEIPGAEVSFEASPSTKTPQALQIVPCMVKLSRIMRKVGLHLYTLPYTIREKVNRARELDAELGCWLQTLPPHLQPVSMPAHTSSLRSRRLTSHVHKQSVVLMIRYYNLRMIVYGKFLTISEAIEVEMASVIREFQQQCIDAAGQAIDLIYETFQNESFFQTWWYNSTYTLFAVSVLLTAVFHRFADSTKTIDSLFGQINRAIAVLEVMDECIVTRNATLIVKRTLARAEKVSQVRDAEQPSITAERTQTLPQKPTLSDFQSGPTMETTEVGGLGQNTEDMAADVEFDWMNTSFPIDDGQQALFWVEWAHHLDDLGS